MLRDKMRWIYFYEMLWDEYRQCADEGRSVEKYASEIRETLAIEDEFERNEKAGKLLELMENAPVKDGFKYDEPTSYDDIIAGMSEEARECFRYDADSLEDKIAGAWYGRIIACVLGIPVEGWERDKIAKYLDATSQAPLKYYISSSEDDSVRKKFDISEEDISTPYDRQKICWYNCLDGKFPNDDDINYTVAALKLIERYGKNFTACDVAETWLLGIPAFHACTAERAAIRNLMNGVVLPASGTYRNPYREWIGAQIRGDFFGYINPGNPVEAARMAYLDASVSHTKNGVYGEMFISALISLCFVPDMTMKERILRAMLLIPQKSRLNESLGEVCGWHEDGWDFEDVVSEVHRRYDEKNMYDWCLTVPNAMLVAACLLYYDNYDDAVTAAVSAGFDTDCNGATVGSIMGAACGFAAIDSKWYKSFDGYVYTSVHGYHSVELKELIERTLKQIERTK